MDSYTIRGRNLRYVPLSELTTLRDQLRREVELASSGGGIPAMYGVKDRRLADS